MPTIHLRRGLAAALFLLPILPPHPAQASSPVDTTAYHRWYQGLRNAEADPDRGMVIEGLTLERDQATLILESGTLHLLEPVEGRTYGAIFAGKGRLRFEAPVPVEQAQMVRFYESESLDEPIETAVFFFTDGTAEDFASAGTFGPTPAPKDARKLIANALEYLSDSDGWVSRDLMTPFLNGTPGFYYAHAARDQGDPFIFSINPYDEEEISLSRKGEGKGRWREVVAQFHKASDYAHGASLPQEALDLVRVGRYDVHTTIADNLDVTGCATLPIEPLQSAHPWVPFTLHSDLTVDSLIWAGGTPATFARPKDSGDLWVNVSSAPTPGAELTFYYHGDLLDQPRRLWVEPKTYTSWYPYHVYNRPAAYRLEFTYPDKFKVGTVGALASEEADGKRITRVWETSSVRQVTFNIGDFDEVAMGDGSGPSLTVQVSEAAHAELNDLAFRAGYLLGEQKDMGASVGGDVRRAFSFFDQAFGPTEVEDFVATEIPFNHGQAFPGLILLSWFTFQKTAAKGYDEMFRAHEVAHQWWGIGVRPATYHDTWLSEGFSEFSGIWYMARVRGSLDLYQDRLKEGKVEILKRRDEAGPIWLGSRVATSAHPEDYQTIVYNKGAWVLHMLRMLLTDYDGGSEDAFESLMHDFYSNHRGKAVTTESFAKAVEATVGDPMAWFFDQWVYRSAIPTYRFAYRLEEQTDGTYKAFVRVKQEDVPDDFQMVVPILLDFGPGGTAVVRVHVTGPVSEMELPLLPMRPARVEFNAYDAVLAEVKTEGW